MNLFDVLLPLALLAGFVRGKRLGISVELIRLFKWVTLVTGGATFAPEAGKVISDAGIFDFASASLIAYLGIALVVFLVFSLIERKVSAGLQRRDAFGRGEYYLGMCAGALRAGCMIMVGLSVLNYRTFTPTQVHAMEKFQRDEYGSEVFPTLYTFQKSVFQDSFTGAWIKGNLSFALLDSAAAADRQGKDHSKKK